MAVIGFALPDALADTIWHAPYSMGELRIGIMGRLAEIAGVGCGLLIGLVAQGQLAALFLLGMIGWAGWHLLAGAAAMSDEPTVELIRADRTGRLINGADEARLHRPTRRVIEAAIGQGGPPLVVVTHHAPHPLCLPQPIDPDGSPAIQPSISLP